MRQKGEALTQQATLPLAIPQREDELRGLSSADVESRLAAGLANVDTTHQRTDGDVIRANTITFFNVVLASMIVALFAIGEFKDGLFVGSVVVANVVISTLQELRAVRTLRELRALTAPQVHVIREGVEVAVDSSEVVKDDIVHLRPGDQVIADGTIVALDCEVDESLLTGESDSVKKQLGSELRSGSFCVAGDAFYRAERVGNEAYAVQLTAQARQIVKRATPLQLRFSRILRVLLLATAFLGSLLMVSYNVDELGFGESIKATTATVTTIVPAGLLLGMTVAFAVGAVRVSRSGAIVQDINAVEALNYVDVICLDKTGTLTANRLKLQETVWTGPGEGLAGWLGAFAAATAGDSKTAGAIAESVASKSNGARPVGRVPFNSERRWSALTLDLRGEQRHFVLGAPETVLPLCDGGEELRTRYDEVAAEGMRGVVFAEASQLPAPPQPATGLKPIALLIIGDELRPEVRSAFAMMEQLGIEPKVISGDNPQTVAALMRQLGITMKGGVISGAELEGLDEQAFGVAVDYNTVFGRIAPAQKSEIVAALREQGHFVAMVGDGANDVQALRTADVAVAMGSGTATARAVAGIVLLNDSFSALIRGAKEATAVLGNAARLSKLFLAKSIYAFLLIFATNMLRLDFPFLPRQSSLTALLTLGIPAVFISISIPPPAAGRDFTRNVLRFAVPASLALAAAAIVVHLLVAGLMGRETDEARTLVSLTLGFAGLIYMLEVLGFEGASWRSLTRPVMTTLLTLALVLAMVGTIYVDWLREFFDFQPVDAVGWTIVLAATAAAIAGQWMISRSWDEILAFIAGMPRMGENIRGRAT
jgi:cation-transporting ATPase E